MRTGISNPLERLWRLQAVVNKLILDGKRDPERLSNILQAFKDGSVQSSFDNARWREQDGVIYFSVESDGTTGEDWITRFESKGFLVGEYAKQVLRSPDFKPTSGVVTEVAVLKGMLFKDNDRITRKIRAEGALRKLSKPNAELACLIREKFTDKEIEAMGLWWIVAMHEPINDSGGDPLFLGANRDDDGRWLNACYVRPDDVWRRDGGFAFVVSQVSAETHNHPCFIEPQS